MKYLIIIAAITLFPQISQGDQIDIPEGWKAPTISNYHEENIKLFNEEPPNKIIADLNGDGTKDITRILINNKQDKWGVFVFLSNGKEGFRTIKLSESSMKMAHLNMGISILKPGVHKTACGKGYYECGPNETPTITLKNPGIDYYVFESASAVFHWSEKEKKFVQTWLSD
jgi:hypothetical protein